jgi:hypothetical protein
LQRSHERVLAPGFVMVGEHTIILSVSTAPRFAGYSVVTKRTGALR